MTSLLLVNNFYYRRVQRKKKATNYCIRFGRSLTAQGVNLLFQIATFSQFQVYLNVTQAKQMTSLLLLNNFYPAISSPTSSKEKESDELLPTVRSLVMVRELAMVNLL